MEQRLWYRNLPPQNHSDQYWRFGACWLGYRRQVRYRPGSGAACSNATRARMVELYGEEWKAGEEKKERVKLAVDHLEQLAFQWSSRCRSLQVILQSIRRS